MWTTSVMSNQTLCKVKSLPHRQPTIYRRITKGDMQTSFLPLSLSIINLPRLFEEPANNAYFWWTSFVTSRKYIHMVDEIRKEIVERDAIDARRHQSQKSLQIEIVLLFLRHTFHVDLSGVGLEICVMPSIYFLIFSQSKARNVE